MIGWGTKTKYIMLKEEGEEPSSSMSRSPRKRELAQISVFIVVF